MRRSTSILVGLMLALGAGCQEYSPLIQRSPSDGATYRCEICRKGERYRSTLTALGDREGRLNLDGKADCIAVSADGSILAVALIPNVGPNEHGHHYLGDHEIVLIDAGSLRVIRRWAVGPTWRPASDPRGYVPAIHNFDKMAFNAAGSQIATFYWQPSAEGRMGPAVTIWDAVTGEAVRELWVPREAGAAGSPGVGAYGLAFSQDNALIVMAGSYGRGKYVAPDGFLVAWRLSDGSVIRLEPVGHLLLHDVCLNESGTRLACWAWGEVPGIVRIMVFTVPDLAARTSKAVAGRVLGIARSDSPDAFDVALKGGKTLRID